MWRGPGAIPRSFLQSTPPSPSPDELSPLQEVQTRLTTRENSRPSNSTFFLNRNKVKKILVDIFPVPKWLIQQSLESNLPSQFVIITLLSNRVRDWLASPRERDIASSFFPPFVGGNEMGTCPKKRRRRELPFPWPQGMQGIFLHLHSCYPAQSEKNTASKKAEIAKQKKKALEYFIP